MRVGEMHPRFKNLAGEKFGKLTALYALPRDRSTSRRWLFYCDCGNEVVRIASAMQKDPEANCGCDMAKRRHVPKTHGMSYHPAYRVWRSMNDRCRLPTHQAWRNYGARGIKVCERWEHSFENFWADMGPTYAKGLELDREDNDAGYSPENCRWITRQENSNNRRANVWIETPRGPMTVGQASTAFGIGKTTILYRLRNGWPMDKLLIAPDTTQRVASMT